MGYTEQTFEEKMRILGNRVSYYKKPEILSLEEWQMALRKQFGIASKFIIENKGNHQYYSDFNVKNTENKNIYKVAIRSNESTGNFCSCMDFKTNCLGTCKHIEAVLFNLENNPKAAKFSRDVYIPTYSSVYLKYGNIRTVKIRIGKENKAEFEKLALKYFNKDLSLNPLAYNHFETLLEEGKAIHPQFRCYTDALEFVLDIREKKRRLEILEKRYHPELEMDGFDKLMTAKLFPFQREGIYFAAKAGKCLLADDMGLGKTVQAIGVSELLKNEFKISKVLIVCPTSLKYQWKTEIEKFTQSTVKVIEGNALKREEIYKKDESYYKIISYNTLSNDVEKINEMVTEFVILDEAQRIKNWKTKIAQNVKKIKTEYAVVLTGTPLENKLEELYSILQFVDAFALGPLYRFLNKHQIKDEHGKVIGYQHLNRIGEDLSEILIRRKKSEVLSQLPERMDKNLFVPMTDKQAEIHQENADAVARLVNKWRRFGFLNEKDRQRLMIAMNYMRMACNSTFIIDQETRYDTKIDELMCILDEVFEQNQEKVVIFSQWERMTRLVSWELEKRKVKFEYLHGGIPSVDRKFLFENFNNDPDCKVFLSTDAGGVGLNLQAASLMINLDIPWNPAVLEQRIARIYRLGQKRNVSIINLVSSGTIEHRMLDVLKFKSSMAEGVLDQGDDTIFMGESKFNQFMKSVEDITTTSAAEDEKLIELPDIENETEEMLAEAAMSNSESETQILANSAIEDIKDSAFNLDEIKDDTGNVKEQKENIEKEISNLPDFNKEPDYKKDPEILPKPGETRETVTITGGGNEAGELIKIGADFFGKLAKTLSDKQETQKLISNLVQKDEKTGQTFVKIPVENEKIVENALNFISGFIGMLKK